MGGPSPKQPSDSTDRQAGSREPPRAEDLGDSQFDPFGPDRTTHTSSLGHSRLVGVSLAEGEKFPVVLAHFLGGLGILVGGVLGFVGPLVIYLMHRDRGGLVEQQAREALNFQLTLIAIAGLVAVLAGFSCGFFLPLLLVPMVMQVIFGVVATVVTWQGVPYRYPVNLRLLGREKKSRSRSGDSL